LKLEKELQRFAVLADGSDRRFALQTKPMRPGDIRSVEEPGFHLANAVERLEVPTEGQQVAPIAVSMHHARYLIIFSLPNRLAESRQPTLCDPTPLRG
jgi:hypothetical protein